MELNNIRLDLKKQSEGTWIDVDGTTQVLIARMNNPKFKRMFEKLAAPYRSAIKRNFTDDDIAEDIMTKVIAKTILLGWKGLTRDGKEVVYSVKEAELILSTPELATFKDLVIESANDEENFRAEEIAVTAKKSEPSTPGK